MRRILLTALASSAVALALPAVASAHDQAGHNARHERVHHHRHHARFVHFASRSSLTSRPGTTSPPTGAAGESVGTIASFQGGVLKITLAEGSAVSGMVTDATEIRCSAPTATMSDHGDRGPGPSSSSGRDGQGDDNGQGDQNGQGDENGGQVGEGPQECTTASLLVGAKVSEAELKLLGSQAIWESVELAG